MKINDLKNKEKIAIVAVGYNRLSSMKRLLSSLNNAHYDHDDIPLVISIDASGDQALYDYASNFEWSHGDLYVNIQKERLGLRKHIIQCGDLTKFFNAVIILEDDIFVSEYFYNYVEKAAAYYYDEERVGGISLYQNELHKSLPICFEQDGSDTYLKQSPASWGECWTDKQWKLFKDWYESFSDDGFKSIDMPENMKNWKKAWSKYYMAYLIDTSRYFVFPYISHTSCFGDAGEHSSVATLYGQANLLCGPKSYNFRPFDQMVRYDIYFTNEGIYDWLGIPKKDLCVDFYGDNPNHRHAKYLLTTANLGKKIIKSFGLQMHPIELNIKYCIEGKDVFLYDTNDCQTNAMGKPYSISEVYYYMRSTSIRVALKYAMHHYLSAIKDKLTFGK